MPSTEYNLAMIQRRLPKESPEVILNVMDELQSMVLSEDQFDMEKITSTGMPPFIVTESGVFEYDCPSDCRRTIGIFTLDIPRGRSRSRPVGPRREYYFRNKRYWSLAITGRPATVDTVAKVYFQEDPGDTTDKYYHAYYVKPTAISDISIQLAIPENVHYLFRDGVVALMTTDAYGKSQFDEYVIEGMRKAIRVEMNKSLGSSVGRTPVREEEQEYDDFGGYGRCH